MNELLAIIAIVVVCCLMFLGWLISMATCPDTMVAFFSGTSPDTNYQTSSRESRELIRKSSSVTDIEKSETGNNCIEEKSDELGLTRSVSAVLQLNASRKFEDKKLSVVDEVDEQSTLQSTIHSQPRPSILRHPNIQQIIVESAKKN